MVLEDKVLVLELHVLMYWDPMYFLYLVTKYLLLYTDVYKIVRSMP